MHCLLSIIQNSEFTICHGYWFFCWTLGFTRRVLLYIFCWFELWNCDALFFLTLRTFYSYFAQFLVNSRLGVPKLTILLQRCNSLLKTWLICGIQDNWLEHWIGCVSGPNMMWLAVVARPCVVKYEDFPTLVTTTRLSLNLRSQQLDWAPSESAFGHDDSGSCPGVGGNIDWSDAHVWIWLFNTWTDTTQTYWQGLAPGGHGPLHSGLL